MTEVILNADDTDQSHRSDPDYAELTTEGSIRKFKFLLLGGRPMVGLQTLDLAIGVRVPASQPHKNQTLSIFSKIRPIACIFP